MKLGLIVELLSGVPLFSGLSDEQLTQIALNGEMVAFDAGQELIHEDESGSAAYLIISGTIKRTAGLFAETDETPFGPGTFVGEMAMLVETAYSSTVSAAAPVKALKFERASMRALMETDDVFVEHFKEKVNHRFVSFVGALQEFRDQFEVPDAVAQGSAQADGMQQVRLV